MRETPSSNSARHGSGGAPGCALTTYPERSCIRGLRRPCCGGRLRRHVSSLSFHMELRLFPFRVQSQCRVSLVKPVTWRDRRCDRDAPSHATIPFRHPDLANRIPRWWCVALSSPTEAWTTSEHAVEGLQRWRVSLPAPRGRGGTGSPRVDRGPPDRPGGLRARREGRCHDGIHGRRAYGFRPPGGCVGVPPSAAWAPSAPGAHMGGVRRREPPIPLRLVGSPL